MLEIIAAKRPSLLMEDAYTTATMPHSQLQVHTHTIFTSNRLLRFMPPLSI